MYDDEDEDDEAWEARGSNRAKFAGTVMLLVFAGPLLLSFLFRPPFRGLGAGSTIAIVLFFAAVVFGFRALRRRIQDRIGSGRDDVFPWD